DFIFGTALSIMPLNANQNEGDSGLTPFTFAVTRTGNIGGTSTADWAIMSSQNSSLNGSDFQLGVLPSGIVNFDPGETAKTVTVVVQGDTIVEPSESFFVGLFNP